MAKLEVSLGKRQLSGSDMDDVVTFWSEGIAVHMSTADMAEWRGSGKALRTHYRKETRTMTKHKTGTREEWLAARLRLLKEEKEPGRGSDELGGGRSAAGPNRQGVSIRD